MRRYGVGMKRGFLRKLTKKGVLRRFTVTLLALVTLLGLPTSSFAAVSASAQAGAQASIQASTSSTRLSKALDDTAAYLCKTVKTPQVGSIGGEWAVLGLARSGYSVPASYYKDYYEKVEKYVSERKGVLHEKKYTEYSRLIVAVSAIGADARNVAGYDLTKALGDYDKTIWQGLNGPIWALIALDSRNYPMPENKEAKTQATRQMYVDRILACQLSDGGWSLTGGTAAQSAGDSSSDPDITGMALQALAKYTDQPKVAKAVDAALACMSKKQDASGGFSSWSTSNSESCAQMIVALCELGVSLDDARFTKNGNTLLDNLLSFYLPSKGFEHIKSSGSNQMATEQAFYALVAASRLENGKNSLYRMSDAISAIGSGAASGNGGNGGNGGASGGNGAGSASGDGTAAGVSGDGTSSGVSGDGAALSLAGKNADVKSMPVTKAGATFGDISAHENRLAIEALASRGIIDGMGDGKFAPDASMTRAQFAAITVRGLGLTASGQSEFTDVAAGKWYAPYIATAAKYGIINGVGGGKFAPESTITRQEAAVMVARAAKLCGMDTAMEAAEVRDVLAQFSDYVKSADWARAGLAFCYDSGILDDADLNINAGVAIKRCEIAQMLYNMLGSAELL